MDKIFKQVSIIGFGLIGSSIARGLKQAGAAERIICVDINPKVCKIADDLGLADASFTSLSEGVKGSDCVILCVPVGAMRVVGQAIADSLEPGVVLTDVGSVKQSVIDMLAEELPEDAEFVPAHPIAGTEHSGPENGLADLFQDRWCILTPPSTVSIRSVEKITALWEALGANIEIMEPLHHDLILGITSHLPHLIAYTIVDTANDLEEDIKSEVIKYSASGFRGFTRIAASDPVMWRDVFLHNKDAVLEILGRFSEDLAAMQKAIRQKDGDYLFKVFSRTRTIRREVMDLGAAGVPSPEREKLD